MQNNDNNLPVQYYYRDVFSDGFMRITTDHCPLSTTQYFLSPRHENNGTLDRASVNEGLCEHGCSVTECKIIMGKTFILSVCDDRSRQYRPGTHCRGVKSRSSEQTSR